MGAFGAGLLGFIGGAAQGELNNLNHAQDMEDKRQLMFAEEMKQRRMAQFALDLQNQNDERRLRGLYSSEFFNNPAYEDITKLGPNADPALVQSILTDRMGKDYTAKLDKIREDEKLTHTAPGVTVATPEQLRELTKNGPWTAPNPDITKPTTPSQLRAALNDLENTINDRVWSGQSMFSSSDRSKLINEGMTLDEIMTEESITPSYQAMLTSIASSKVISDVKAQVNQSPSMLEYVDPEQVAKEVSTTATKIHMLLEGAIKSYSDAIPKNITGYNERAAYARQLLKEGFKVKDTMVNPIAEMEKRGLYSPIMNSIIISSLSAAPANVTGSIQR